MKASNGLGHSPRNGEEDYERYRLAEVCIDESKWPFPHMIKQQIPEKIHPRFRQGQNKTVYRCILLEGGNENEYEPDDGCSHYQPHR
jgi:hypothetical protein